MMGADLNISFSDRAMTLEKSIQPQYSLSMSYIISLGANMPLHYFTMRTLLLLTDGAKQPEVVKVFEGLGATAANIFSLQSQPTK